MGLVFVQNQVASRRKVTEKKSLEKKKDEKQLQGKLLKENRYKKIFGKENALKKKSR